MNIHLNSSPSYSGVRTTGGGVRDPRILVSGFDIAVDGVDGTKHDDEECALATSAGDQMSGVYSITLVPERSAITVHLKREVRRASPAAASPGKGAAEPPGGRQTAGSQDLCVLVFPHIIQLVVVHILLTTTEFLTVSTQRTSDVCRTRTSPPGD